MGLQVRFHLSRSPTVVSFNSGQVEISLPSVVSFSPVSLSMLRPRVSENLGFGRQKFHGNVSLTLFLPSGTLNLLMCSPSLLGLPQPLIVSLFKLNPLDPCKPLRKTKQLTSLETPMSFCCISPSAQEPSVFVCLSTKDLPLWSHFHPPHNPF